MNLASISEYQHRLIEQLEAAHLHVSFGNDLGVLMKTYGAATGTGYVQWPFVIEDPRDAHPCNFWVCFDDGNEPMALTGFRTVRHARTAMHVGRAFQQGALYKPNPLRAEGWLTGSGPVLQQGDLYGYIGAGWVHPRFRGQNLAGYIARIAQAESLLRSRGDMSIVTAMTMEPLFKSGMNLRASGLHHLHVEQVLDGYFRVSDADARLYLSYSTGEELAEFYDEELDMLRDGAQISWLHGHDKTHASEVVAARRVALAHPQPAHSAPAVVEDTESQLAALA